MRKVIINKKLAEVTLSSCEADQIYAYYSMGHVYKLHRVNSEQDLYAFICLDDSISWANGVGSFDEEMRTPIKNGTEIYEFVDVKEFINWCKKVLYT